ncbi:MAG: YtxH domain-containing protein [Ignavibacteriales bacterium]|nr:YtxH domain-containing protein [Ignavibacteriales bacterium]MCB9258955.1 YtxH domain-containing protein [Ignavibacteriales bacterium]
MLKKNIKVKNKLTFLFMLLFLGSIILTSCDKAKETVEEATDKVTEKTEEVISETADKVNEVAEDASKKVEKVAEEVKEAVDENFLVGTWSGKFDGRNTVMTITKQDGNKIEGKITINFREVINQEIKGNFDPESNTLKMTDQLHSRYQGSYSGKLSEDKTNYSGEFTMKLNGNKMSFNLNKK